MYAVSQESDTTLVRLERGLKLASNDTTKIKAMLSLGTYRLDHDFNKAEQNFEDALEFIETFDGEDPQKIKQALNSLIAQLRLQIDTEGKLSDLQEKIDYVN